MRRVAVVLALVGLSTTLAGGALGLADGGAGFALTFLVGLPVTALAMLYVGSRKAPGGRAGLRREGMTFLGAAVVASALFFPGLVALEPGLMLAGAAVPLLAAAAYLALPPKGVEGAP